MKIDFYVSNDSLSLATQGAIFTGNRNYYALSFAFLTSDWDNLSKFAVFTYEGGATSVPLENGECFLPEEALKADGGIYVGVFGVDEDDDFTRISTGLLYIPVFEGAYRSAAAPSVPSPDLWEEYYAEITKVGGYCDIAQNAAQNAKESASASAQAFSDLLKMLGSDIATLVGGKIPAEQIPSLATTEVFFAASQEEMDALTVQNGDICIRLDENKSYIYSGGWIFLVSPTDYCSKSGYAESAKTAQNAAMINNHRLVEMTAEEFEVAQKDDDTYYLVY